MSAIDEVAALLGREPTRGEIADALGVHPSTISRRLSGDDDFSLGEVIQLCRFFHVSAAEALVRLGALEAEDVGRAAGIFVRPLSDMTDRELLEELATRAEERDENPRPRRRRRQSQGGLFN